jgi:hypothetical protein
MILCLKRLIWRLEWDLVIDFSVASSLISADCLSRDGTVLLLLYDRLKRAKRAKGPKGFVLLGLLKPL